MSEIHETAERIWLHTKPGSRESAIVQPDNGEVIKSASIDGNMAYMVFFKKFGKDAGFRVVTLSDNGKAWTLVCESRTGIPDEKSTDTSAAVPDVVTMYSERQSTIAKAAADEKRRERTIAKWINGEPDRFDTVQPRRGIILP